MQEQILRSVAAPPKLFWAPFKLGAANFMFQIPFLFMAVGAFNMNPIIFCGTIVAAHAVLASWGAKEPHLFKMLQTYGPMAGKSNNIYKVKGNKLVP